MLAVRAILFTILLPGTLTMLVPWLIVSGSPPAVESGRYLGLVAIAAGTIGYLASALEFLLRGNGTPALFLTKPLRFLIGEEPKKPIESALYKHTRNPMYLSVVWIVIGETMLYESGRLLIYAVGLGLAFHLTVVFVEVPHLRQRPGYDEYCARVPRWLVRK
jgi:hypothetical protein